MKLKLCMLPSTLRTLQTHKRTMSSLELENERFFTSVLLFTAHESVKGRFSQRSNYFRTLVSEGSGMISLRERKQGFLFTGLYFDKVVLFKRIDVSPLTSSHIKCMSILFNESSLMSTFPPISKCCKALEIPAAERTHSKKILLVRGQSTSDKEVVRTLFSLGCTH